MSAELPPWYGLQKGAFVPLVDFDLDGAESADRDARDDVGPALLGLLAPVIVLAAVLAMSTLPLLAMIGLGLAGAAWLLGGGIAVFNVAFVDDPPTWAGLATYMLAALGTVIKWTIVITTVVVALAMLLAIVMGISGSDRR